MKRHLTFRPIVLTFIYQSALIMWTGIFYVTFIQLFEIYNPYAIYFFAGLLIFLGFALSIAWLLIMRRHGKWRVWFFASVAGYLGTMHFLVLGSALYWLIQISNDAADLHWPTLLIGRWIILVGLLVSVYGVWKSYQIKVVKYKVKIKNLPEFWKHKKVVMFADTHLGNIRGLKFIQQTVNLVKKEKPDMVLIPGDYFDGPPADFVSLAAPLEELKPKLGIYFCDGNHEEFKHDVAFVHALQKAGVIVLNNAFVEVQGLQIIGVDYRTTRGTRHLRKILKKLDFDRSLPSILMKHVPSGFKAAQENNIALMVSGHTHMGQVFPFNLLTKLLFKGFDYGHNFYKKLQVITTVGVGTWGPPQRVGTHSEIVVIELE